MRGLTPDDAIAVASVRDEYQWLNANYPGHRVLGQRLIDSAGTPMDAVSIATADGAQVEVFFDISSFFGRVKEPGPPCPFCGQPLRTARARQCRHCGKAWHDQPAG